MTVARIVRAHSNASWLAACLCCVAANTALAVLPPYVYKERIEKSKIKAIAEVQAIKVTKTSRGVQIKLVTFKLEQVFVDGGVPASFTGQCHSLLPGVVPAPGGTIYMRPQKGERVYVTVSQNGGQITSYTRMTPRLDEALRKRPETVKPGMATVRVEDDADKHVDAANALADKGQHAEAMAELEKAFAVTSLCPRAYWVRGKVLDRAGKRHEAIADYSKAVELDSRFYDAYRRRGIVHEESGHYAKAAADFERCIALRPESASGYNALAWLRATCAQPEHRDPRKALSLAKKAVAMDRRPHVLDTLACAYAANGQFARAARTQQEAVSACRHPGARQEYAERLALFRQGKAYVAPGPAQ